MPPGVKKEIQLEIAHVLFVDIVGYSKLLINEQHELLQELNQIVRTTEAFRAAEAAGKLIRLPTGDGMALAFATTPDAPVQCALEISKALKSHPELGVRMGIHSGPVSGLMDVNDRSNIAGTAINMAQRLMDCGDAGHILLSRRVAEDLEQYRQWQPHLHDLGECEVKHGVRVSVVNLYTDELGNADLPAKFKTVVAAVSAAKRSSIKRKGLLIAGVIIVALAIASFLFWQQKKPKTSAIAAAISDKSIAVLPFENLSEEKGNAYFVAGMQDEILTALAKISDLKVISRTSTAKYTSHPDNLKAIAQELGVKTILEGSVQKVGEAVHINLQLINGLNDAHLWAESYDRDLRNIFGVERDVAETVAGQLKAKLLPQESVELARVPTSDPEAYDLYLKGKYVAQQYWNAQVDSVKPAIEFYRQAIARDPGFALAYAALANAEDKMYIAGEDHSPERLADVQANAEKSLALQPDLAEGRVVLAEMYNFVKHDPAKALAECEPLLSRAPNNPQVILSAAQAKGHLGDWKGSLAGTLRAVELDPRNNRYLRYLADLYAALKRYPEAEGVYQKVEALAPDDWIARSNRAAALILQGKLADAREALQVWPDAKLKETALSVKYSTLQQIETLARNYDAALAAAFKIPMIPNRLPNSAIPIGDIKKNTDIGYDGLYKGDAAGAQRAFTAAREGLDEQRAGHQDDPNFYNNEALIDAGMNNCEAAIQAARKAVALVPTDPNYLLTLAQVYAHCRNADQAVSIVDKLLEDPVGGTTISSAVLRLDPIWDPIRNNRRFHKLSEDKQP
jgi:TolB-like protein/class 3 adenylate cyclase/predicted Zn-dependent protease